MHLIRGMRARRSEFWTGWRGRLCAVLVAVTTGSTALVLTAPAAAAGTYAGFTFVAGTALDFGVTTAGSEPGPTVTGHASARTPAAETTTIRLNAPRTSIVMQSFSLGAEDTLNLVFGSANDIVSFYSFGSSIVAGTVNTYVGSVGGQRGGNVWLTGVSGVTFTGTADVEVGGVLATANRSNSTTFLAGTYDFASPFNGAPHVTIGNGASVVGHGGLVAFIGPTVHQSAGATVTAAENSGTEVLYASAHTAALRLAERATGPGLLGLTSTAAFMDGGVGPWLFGSTTAPDVYVSGGGTSYSDVRLAGPVSATGAPADGSGNVVVTGGQTLTRASVTDPVGPGGTTAGYYVRAEGPVDATRRILLSATSSTTVSAGAKLSSPSVVLSGGDTVYNGIGADAVDVGPDGQWVVYAGLPETFRALAGTSGTLDSGNPAVWGTDLAGTPPSALTGNRYVFRHPPAVTFTAQDVQKPYGTELTSLPTTESGPHLGVDGLWTADPAPGFTGAPSVTTDGAAADARVLRTGPYPVLVSQGSLASTAGYRFRYAPGRLTVTDSTPAEVTATVSGPLGSNGWYTGDATVDWTVTDPESWADPADCADVLVAVDQPETPYGCSVTGPGGPATGTATVKRDSTPPELVVRGRTGAADYTPGTWTAADVAVTYECTDATSGVSTTTDDTVATASGDHPGTCTDRAGNTTTVPFRVDIDAIPPSVSDEELRIAGTGTPYVPGTWAGGAVTLSWACTDEGGSGVADGPRSTTAGSTGTLRAVCTDVAGNTVEGEPFQVGIDGTAPTILEPTLTSGGAPYAEGDWARGAVTLTWGCADTGGAGPARTDGEETATASGTLTATCTDTAGNEVTETFDVLVDDQAPAVGDVSLTTADGAAYPSGSWTGQAVTLTWTCTDGPGQSGAAEATGAATATSTGTLRASCTDVAGNGAQGETFQANIDTTAPVLSDVPADQSLATTGGDATATWTGPAATDDQDPTPDVVCDPASGSSFSIGTTTVTCTATDHAGNTARGTFGVTVTREEAVVPDGVVFRAPIDAPPVVNVAARNRYFPVRISVPGVTAPAGPVDPPLATGTPERVSCPARARTDAVETYTSRWAVPTNLFSWDARRGNWLAKVSTWGLARGACYRVPVTFGGTVTDRTASGGSEIGFFYLRTR